MEVLDERKEGTLDKIKNSGVMKKLKGIKNIQVIVAIFIIAVALLIYSSVATRNAAEKGANSYGQSASMDDEERKLASILGGIEGAGRVETMITRDENDVVVGVLVIAEGADDIAVMLKLLAAATTAMGVDKSIVDVYTMK